MAFDYKKEYKDLYLPKNQPAVIEVPPIHYVAVEGTGDPNTENGSYAEALSLLYSLSFTIKMSYKGGKEIEGYFPYVVPPLEGLWWMKGGKPDINYAKKSDFCWISMIRLPEFVTEEIFIWAKKEVEHKKKIDTNPAQSLLLEEGLCVQCMHIGSYDEEPTTITKIDAFAQENGYIVDLSPTRRHHEIYLSDPRRTAPEKLRTVIRHPVVKIK